MSLIGRDTVLEKNHKNYLDDEVIKSENVGRNKNKSDNFWKEFTYGR